MTRWRRSPRALQSSLGVLRGQLAPATLLAEVQEAWPQAVGVGIAAHARPTTERQGVVVVSCSAAVWAQELELMAPVILERLNALLQGGTVIRLRCVTIPPPG